MTFLFIGLFCLLAVVGFFLTGSPFKFAIGGIISLIAITFVLFVLYIIWVMASPCSAPFTDHSSTYCQNQAASLVPSTSTTNTVPVYTSSGSSQTTTSAGALPTEVNTCDNTTVTQIGTRLTDGTTGQPIPGTGSAIWYADGGYQVSYDTVQGIVDSQVGDQIKLCLISIPTDCPPGDNRGKVYAAKNLRTNEAWEAQDSEHSCGGA